MFKIFSRKAKPEADAFPNHGNQQPETPEVATDSEGKPQLDLIVVPQSAFDAYPDNPDLLVQALVDYVNQMTGRGRYMRDELPAEAIQAFHCDYYLAQVLNGGHAQFVGNAKQNRDNAIADTIAALTDLGATEYLSLTRQMADWVAQNAEAAEAQTGFEGGIAPELAALDDPFYALNTKNPLRARLADWLVGLEILQVVADEKLPEIYEGIARLNGRRAHRDQILRLANVAEKMTNPVYLGMGMAAGSSPKVEAMVAVGNGSYREVDGQKKLCFALKTNAGSRWGIADEHGATLREWISQDNPDLPKDLSQVSMEDIKNFRPPEVGPVINNVPKERIDAAAQICDQLHAAAAIDLLLSRYEEAKVLDAISVRSVGPDQTGALGLSALLVANKAHLALCAIVTEQEARLLSEPGHKILATATSAEISDHADAFAMEHFA